ncbi:NUDIX domain-containing protein [Kitasatospora sp. NPDC051853]|uniref:NUDIX domain-containing protein n=1 Tax=Kitasatospora sp. NPDC051853 TaxID=3364058 RepID=UPI0037908E24
MTRVLSASSGSVLVTAPDGRVLLVHHARSGTWLLPGGKAETESPKACAEREGREELGVPVTVGRLLAVHYLTGAKPLFPAAARIPGAYPCTMFTFTGAIHPDDWDRIAIPAGELHGWATYEPEDAAQRAGLMESANAAHLLACVEAARTGATAYLEDGHQL